MPAQPEARPVLAIRDCSENPNHHIWDNNGIWFVHYTLHPTPLTAERVRRSLRTRDVREARRRRDALFAKLAAKAVA